MERLRKILTIFMAFVMLLGATLTINAATNLQDGIEVTLNTNLQSYDKGEDIVTAITVKNTNDFTVYDVALECIAPDGYQISENVGVNSIPALAGKEAVTLTVTSTPMSGGVTATGDSRHVLLWTALLAVALAAMVTLGVVYHKKWKRLLSVILCLTLVLGLLPANMVRVSAADDVGSISVFETVTVGGKKVKVEGVVTYSLTKRMTGYGAEATAAPSPEVTAVPTPSPEVSATPEASEAPTASPEVSETPEASEAPTASPEVNATPDPTASPEVTATPTPSPAQTTSPGGNTENDGAIFAEYFESYTAGALLAVGTTDTGLNVAAVAASLIIEENTDGNQVLKTEYSGTNASAESQLDFAFSKGVLAQYSSITLEFDAYVEGTSELRPNVRSYDGAASIGTFKTFINSHFNGFSSANLMPVKIVFDLENGSQTLYVNEKAESPKRYTLKDGSALTEGFLLRLRLTAMNTGDDILLDNIVITGVEKDTSGDSSTGDDTTTGDGTDYTKPESGDGVNVLLNDDFEAYTIDEDDYDDPSKGNKGWTGSAINAGAAMQIVEETTENQVLKAFHGDPTATGATTRNPRVEYLVSGDYSNITLDIDVKITQGKDAFGIHAYQNDTNKTKIGTLVSVSNSDCAEWTHIKIIFDLKNDKQNVYVGGALKGTYTYDLDPESGFKLYFSASVAADSDNSYVMIDNALITTTDEIQEGIVAADKSINWDKVVLAESEKTGLLGVMDTSHPRIYVNDWSEVKAKATIDKESKAWYDTIIAFADEYLAKEPVAYVRNSRGNLNDCSTAFKNNIIPVAAAACLTDDASKKAAYKERVYEELEAIGNWPDWGSDAYLCTAHIIFAYALCYDWMYDQWSDMERTNIENWMLTMGMSQAILNYEGITTSTTNINTTINNWNNVCNGSNMVGAIALAGELTGDYAGVADYIIAKAAAAIPNTFVELTEDGAYAEPLSYWDYGIRHQVKVMAALDSCLKEGATLPAILDFGNVSAADAKYQSYAIGMSNTGGFPIYYNGTTGSFNYGDGTIALVTSPIMYWLSNKFEKSEYSWYNLYMMNNNEHVTEVSAKDATLSLVWYDPTNSDIPEDGFDLDKFYQSYEAAGTNGISMRSSWEDEDALYVAVHAGDETVAHSNLDAGGFVLDWNNQRWVHMYGRNPGGYTNTYGLTDYNTKKESGRYQYYNTRGEANNTIIAYSSAALASGNIPAVDMDIDYFAAVKKYESGVNTSYGIVDMTDTNSALYTSAKRGVMLTGYRDIVVVQDEITAKEASDFYWFVNTNAEITISPDGKSALWEMNGDRMLVRITQALTDGTENSDAQFGIMNAETLDFVTLNPKAGMQVPIDEHKMFIRIPSTTTLNLTVEFVPLEDGEGVPDALDIVALANWGVDTGASQLTSQTLGDIVAVLPGSPNAYVKGAKTQVNTADTGVTTVNSDGTVYVPADFVTEVFGAHILTTTTFNNVNYVAVNDVANTFGKVVTVDSTYGLVFIADKAVSYDASTLKKIYDLLDIRVFYELQNKAQSLTEDFENCTVGTALNASGTGLVVTTDDASMTIGEVDGNKVAQTGGFTEEASSVTSKINFALTPDMLKCYDKLEISMNVLVEGSNTLELRVRTNEDGNIGNFKTVEAEHITTGEMVPVIINFDFANNSHQLTFNGKPETAKKYTIRRTDGFLFALWMNNSNEGDNILVDDIVITGIDASDNRTELRNENFEADSYKDNTTITTKVVTWLNKVEKKAETLAIASVNGDKMLKATHFAKASSHVVKAFSADELANYKSMTVAFDTMVKGISEMALNVLDPNDKSLGTFKTLKAGVSNFAVDKWYNVKIVFDFETGEQTLSLKAADATEYAVENAKSYTWKDEAKTSLASGFKLRLNITDKVYGGAENTNGVLIDNLVITGEPKDKTTGEITFFDPEITEYYVQVSKSQEVSGVSATSLDNGRNISAVSANQTSTVTIDGVDYTIHFVENPFEGLIGTGSAGVASSISLGLATPLTTPSEQTWLSVQNVTSSIGAWEDSANYIEQGTIDGIISAQPINRWSANGHGNWICYDLGSAQTVYSMAIAGYNSSTRQYTFKIEYSTDGENWTTAVEAGETTAGNDHEVFKFPDGVTAQYIKVTGTYASNSTWIGINEVRIYSSEAMQNADQEAWVAYFYPDTVYGHVGDTVALKLTGYDASGNEVVVDVSTVTFTSANESVATVDASGVITLKATGTTAVQAEMTVLGVTKTTTIDVIVQ